MGAAFAGMRDRVILATKTAAQTADGFWKDLESSLRALGTDHIDVYQFHNPAFCPRPGGADGLYDAALEAKRQGKIRHISITNHSLAVAHEAIGSGLYDTLQFPFSYMSGAQELELVEKCRAADMGFIAMKGLAGGLIRDGLTAAAFMEEHPTVLPIWGVQRRRELDQFLSCVQTPPAMTGAESCDPPGPGGAGRGFLPGLRLLYALSGGNRDQQLCPHEPDASPGSRRGLADAGVAGEDGADRAVPPLWTVQVEMPLWIGYAPAFGGKLCRLSKGPGGTD